MVAPKARQLPPSRIPPILDFDSTPLTLFYAVGPLDRWIDGLPTLPPFFPFPSLAGAVQPNSGSVTIDTGAGLASALRLRTLDGDVVAADPGEQAWVLSGAVGTALPGVYILERINARGGVMAGARARRRSPRSVLPHPPLSSLAPQARSAKAKASASPG